MAGLLLAAVLGTVVTGCARRAPAAAPPAPVAVAPKPGRLLSPEAVGAPADARPLLTHLAAVDLDGDGREDLVACDARANTVSWLRQLPDGSFAETVLAADIPGPVHAAAVDLDGDGDLDLLVAGIGDVFPNNDRIGTVWVLEDDGHQRFTPHAVLEHVARVTDVEAADFDGDGQLDLAVAEFGYDQGEIRWLRNLGGGRFESHLLLSLPGTINVCLADFDGDGHPDIAALVSQQYEEVHLFRNDGHGGFRDGIVYGSTNEDFGSSGLTICDLNRDGRPDLLYTNGDGFDYAEPGARPWHGVQWLENRGDGTFTYHRIGDLPGAYAPVGVDLDGDGATDVVAVSGFNDWRDPGAVSLMLFRNDGRQNFTPEVLGRVPTHLITCAPVRLGSGRAWGLATGGFHAYPPYGKVSRITLWRPRP